MQTWIGNALLSPYKIETIIIEDEQALILGLAVTVSLET
jgi:hypothetical protein